MAAPDPRDPWWVPAPLTGPDAAAAGRPVPAPGRPGDPAGSGRRAAGRRRAPARCRLGRSTNSTHLPPLKPASERPGRPVGRRRLRGACATAPSAKAIPGALTALAGQAHVAHADEGRGGLLGRADPPGHADAPVAGLPHGALPGGAAAGQRRIAVRGRPRPSGLRGLCARLGGADDDDRAAFHRAAGARQSAPAWSGRSRTPRSACRSSPAATGRTCAWPQARRSRRAARRRCRRRWPARASCGVFSSGPPPTFSSRPATPLPGPEADDLPRRLGLRRGDLSLGGGACLSPGRAGHAVGGAQPHAHGGVLLGPRIAQGGSFDGRCGRSGSLGPAGAGRARRTSKPASAGSDAARGARDLSGRANRSTLLRRGMNRGRSR